MYTVVFGKVAGLKQLMVQLTDRLMLMRTRRNLSLGEPLRSIVLVWSWFHPNYSLASSVGNCLVHTQVRTWLST